MNCANSIPMASTAPTSVAPLAARYLSEGMVCEIEVDYRYQLKHRKYQVSSRIIWGGGGEGRFLFYFIFYI